MSCALLLYTAIVVPIQILVWDYNDPCNKFPTLFLDLFVDSFFLVSSCGYDVSSSHYAQVSRLWIEGLHACAFFGNLVGFLDHVALRDKESRQDERSKRS
jgi:hypothetical protein